MRRIPASATVKQPASRFTGDVYFDEIARGKEPSRLRVVSVHFVPGARTAWHVHALGQTLHVTDGIGCVQARGGDLLIIQAGDTIYTPPGEWHWHGAAPDHFMTHLAIWEAPATGPEYEWGEHVTDAEYAQQSPREPWAVATTCAAGIGRAQPARCAATTSTTDWSGGSCTSMRDEAMHHRWVRVGEHRIFTRVWMRLTPATIPDLEPVVLVHGLGVSSRYMMPTALRLCRYRRVYALDLPGFGASSRPGHALSVADLAHVVTHWMDGVGLARAVLLGNSLGCQVLAHVAVAHPERVAQAILVGPTMDPSAGAVGQVGRLLRDTFAEPPSYLPLLIRDYLRAGPVRTLATFRLGLRDCTFALYPAMAMPTLIVRGGRDPIAPQRWAMALASRVPHGSLAVIPGKGHAANYNAPDELVDLVQGFLTQKSSTQSRCRTSDA